MRTHETQSGACHRTLRGAHVVAADGRAYCYACAERLRVPLDAVSVPAWLLRYRCGYPSRFAAKDAGRLATDE